MLTNCY